ncbi:UDP-galactopyranose mutase [Advenella sp. S44]|uniref:UDP-galactopyranose mutase n=1 Tax=Advenella sp. S44 TaxID=1982755 RepID=UPI000C2A5897|nr:UDP-galactopyranose mutase [Advenella sp. S44]PJX25515.1 UDP-galactopyranose mutase [Advenella sp. S44]
MEKYDVIVVGSGFAGAIIAERYATQLGRSVLVIEQRDHIAGNMFDYHDENQILVHKYGPHLFRTDSPRVLEYLSQYTDWHPYQHRVLAEVQGKMVPVPFNLTSLERLLPDAAEQLKTLLIEQFGMDVKVPVSKLRKHENPKLQQLGDFIFENIYLNYTTKQWGDKPENLDFETITARVPVHISYDDRYFQESHQALPKEGYTEMFRRMLDHPSIDIVLSTNAHSVLKMDAEAGQITYKDEPFTGTVVYTGALDELFSYCYGELPYRSLRFDLETHDVEYYQPTGTVNYPNQHLYTRISEYKHMMADKPKKTTIMKEFPQEYDRHDPSKNIPYYPIPKPDNETAYQKYKSLAQQLSNLIIVGRLAEYRYYDMNNIINRALDVFEQEIIPKERA